MARRTSLAVLALALAGIAAAPSSAAPSESLTSTWASVNVCSDEQLGARAQLTGDGSRDRLRVRFTAEWLSPEGWAPLAGDSTSPWQDAGSAEFTWGQAGFNFALRVPQTGATYELRAVAEMRLGSGGSHTQVTGTCTVGG